MGYYWRGDVRGSSESDAHSSMMRTGFTREVTSKSEVMKRINTVAHQLPLGTEILVFRVYRMSRGYEPDKPRPGSEDKHEQLKLVDKGAWYDPKTGKPRPPKWKRVEPSRDRMRRRS